MAFDREKFLAANQRVRDNNPGLTAFPEGIYNCTLIDAGLNKAKSSGREQASFVWQVNPPDDLAEKKIYDHVGIESDTGMEVLNVKLSTLGVKDFNEFANDFEGNLQRMVNRTQARIKISHNVKDGVEYQQLRVQKLIQSAFQNGMPVNTEPVNQHLPINAPISETQTQVEKPKEINLQVESVISVKTKDGEQLAIAKNYNKPAGKVFVQFKNTELGTALIDVKDIIQVFPPEVAAEVATEVVEEVVEEVVIQVGMKVNFTLNNNSFSGEVTELLPAEGLVKVKFTDPKDNKQKIWKGSIEKVSLIS